MRKDDARIYDNNAIMKLLDIQPNMHLRLRQYGDMGENAFDVYTLYKSAAKRRLTDIVEVNDVFDLRCLAWMTKKDFIEAKRLLRRLGYITEMIDQGRPEVSYVRLVNETGRAQ
ncbi:MAG TPA: hypothetical protein ENN05_06400 [Deltaproteobacteria bacterium]|nr:hypothetical protein [Deltaproteobacteria bacterium]